MADDTTDDAPAPAENAPAKTYTQAEHDAMLRRTAAESRKAATQELANQLGVPVHEAKQLIDAVKVADENAKSDTQRALDAAKAARAEAEAMKAQAGAERLAMRIERKLLSAGLNESALARATRMVTLEPDADEDAINAEIDAIKAEVPGLFGPITGSAPPPAPGVAPSRPPARQGSSDPVTRGAELYALKHNNHTAA